MGQIRPAARLLRAGIAMSMAVAVALTLASPNAALAEEGVAAAEEPAPKIGRAHV